MIGEGTEHDKKKSEHQRFRKLTFIIKNLGGGIVVPGHATPLLSFL